MNKQDENFNEPVYYGMTLEPFYVGGKNADKLNTFSSQLNNLRSKGFYNEANQLYKDGKQYGVDQALYNLAVKAEKQKEQRRINEIRNALHKGTGNFAYLLYKWSNTN